MYRVKYGRIHTVDLEKRKVVFPDWTQQAKHYPAVVQRCVLTRNKERVYDIEYDDGSKLSGVREEYIRLLGGNQSISNIGNKIASRLQEGVRVVRTKFHSLHLMCFHTYIHLPIVL